MSSDSPIVQEVRRRRHEISARYDHDLDKYFDHLLELQQQYKERLVDQVTVVKSDRRDKDSSQ
jgi:hypothetical protein